MSNWTEAELNKIAAADDLHVSPSREDGKTYGTPTWIWSVVVDDGLYARGYNGRSSRWYKSGRDAEGWPSESREWSVRLRSSLQTANSTIGLMRPIE